MCINALPGRVTLKVGAPLERVVCGHDWSLPQIHSHNTKESRTREEGERAYLSSPIFSFAERSPPFISESRSSAI